MLQRADDAEAIPEETRSDQNQWRCHRAGRHLCGEGGARVWAYRNSILRFLKERAPKKSNLHQALVDGRVFIALFRMPAEPADPKFQLDLDGLTNSEFWHISHMCLSPYRPTLQAMIIDGLDANVVSVEVSL